MGVALLALELFITGLDNAANILAIVKIDLRGISLFSKIQMVTREMDDSPEWLGRHPSGPIAVDIRQETKNLRDTLCDNRPAQNVRQNVQERVVL